MDPESEKVSFEYNTHPVIIIVIPTLAKSMVSAARAANLSLLSLLDSE